MIIIGFVFGIMIDMNMALTSFFSYNSLWKQICAQFVGCTVMGVGIAMEVKCGSVTMPGEGIQVAVARVSGRPFPQIKIIIDSLLVGIAVTLSFVFWGEWKWNIIGVGTLFAMFYVGLCVKWMNRRMKWFDYILGNNHGLPRFLFGLARFRGVSDKVPGRR